jgi:hypothetical protein
MPHQHHKQLQSLCLRIPVRRLSRVCIWDTFTARDGAVWLSSNLPLDYSLTTICYSPVHSLPVIRLGLGDLEGHEMLNVFVEAVLRTPLQFLYLGPYFLHRRFIENNIYRIVHI